MDWRWLRNLASGAGEVPQRLRALAALPKNPGSSPSTHMAAHNCSSSSKGPDTLTQIYKQETWLLTLELAFRCMLDLVKASGLALKRLKDWQERNEPREAKIVTFCSNFNNGELVQSVCVVVCVFVSVCVHAHACVSCHGRESAEIA